MAGRLAACIDDPRDPTRTLKSAGDISRFRMLMIAAGYENRIDDNALRADPVFEMALERTPGARDLCSQSTVSRLEKPARPAHAAAHGTGDGGALLRQLRAGPQAHRPRHPVNLGRHLRRSPWRPAVAADQRHYDA